MLGVASYNRLLTVPSYSDWYGKLLQLNSTIFTFCNLQVAAIIDMAECMTVNGVDVNPDQLIPITENSSKIKKDAADIFNSITNYWMKDVIEPRGDKIEKPVIVGKTHIDKKEFRNKPLPLSDSNSWFLPSYTNKARKEKFCVRVVAVIYERIDHDDYACMLCKELQKMFSDDTKKIMVQSPKNLDKHDASCIFIKFKIKDNGKGNVTLK